MEETFSPVELIDGDWSRGLLLLCDHARNTIPAGYGTLGVPPGELVRHIAYDIGARDVTLGLAQRLGVPAVLSTFSRLLIDPNRGEDDPTIVMRLSDGTIIPGNHPISEAEIAHRIERFHRPYHDAIEAAINKALRHGVVPAVFSIHSFTPSWKAFRRPWQVALLWDSDPRFTDPLINALRADGSLTVGDNEPYDGALRNDTMYRHCTRRGLAHALIEIRQDLIGHEAGASEWCDRLAPMLEEINGLAQLHAIRHFGSRTGPVEPMPAEPIHSQS
ncbi:MAG: N-formylglutamate amidohydrolase [Nitratireductor sp.]|nr:N-formylglutamate amidohydrolase [Nitratireductor sp.]